MDELWDKYSRVSRGWRIDPIAKVHPRIYLGSAEHVDMITFQSLGITHAVNCAEDMWSARWLKHKHPERYVCIGAEDSETFNIMSVYPKFEKTMNEFLADPSCHSIFVHCQCGINRSAFLLLVYIYKKFNYAMNIGIKHILLQRPCCFRNTAFRKQVTDYIKKLE